MLRRILLITALLITSGAAHAAEITLRAQTHAAKGIVTLGDVAEVHGPHAAELQAIELVPAPSAGRTKTLLMREVQDLLALNGVNLIEHQFSGATRVEIGASVATVADTAPSLKASRSVQEQVTKRVERAIQKHLQQVADERIVWDVAIELSDEQIAAIGVRHGEINVQGGARPWTGAQQFVLQANTSTGLVRLPVSAQVRMPAMVVVPKRPLRKGEVIRATDVELQMPKDGHDDVTLATHLEDIVGRETVRSMATGQPIETAWVRKPILVRRGEIVTVLARTSNLIVRMQARATEEGGRDDLVNVERLDNRERFTARVTNVQEVEVLVGGSRVSAARATTR